MEIKVNKEIRDYTESIFFGLSMRQFIFALLACVVAIGLYFLFKDHLGTEMLSWVCILGAVPFAILGFLKYNGMYAEEFIVAWVKSEILTPRILFFQAENIYYELLKEEYNNKEMEELKSETVKKGQRESKNTKKCATSNTNKSNIRRWRISSGQK